MAGLIEAAVTARAKLDDLGPERMASFDLADAPRLVIVAQEPRRP